MSPRDKIFANRELSDYETEMVRLVFEQNDLIQYLEDGYIYIMMGEQGDMEIMNYPNELVEKTMNEIFVDEKQCIEYLYNQEIIEQHVAELCYWTDIGDYKKYVPVTKHAYDGHEEIKEYADYYFFATNEIDAAEFMTRNAYFDYLYVEDVDGE